MRLLTFVEDGKSCVGAERDDVVVDLSAQFPDATINSIFADDRIAEAETAANQAPTVYVADEVA